jgi:pyruvate formate lyase activating enzyme
MEGTVFDIQHYAIYDGPGIRTTVFLKGCPLRCMWCHNPESQRAEPELGYLREQCALCGRCVEACPHSALSLAEDGVTRDAERCCVCGKCVEACLNGARELIGRTMSVAEVVEIVARDRPFYDNSGGGVTISGGEPTAQVDFLLELLASLQERGIATALETSGLFHADLVERLVSCVDLFLYDVKCIDEAVHRQFTGVSNRQILANFEEILGRAGVERVLPRIPVIPGFNAAPDAIDQITAFLKGLGYSGAVHAMPYNKLAKTKYEKLGVGEAYADMGELTEPQLEAILERIARSSFTAVCNH